MNKENITRVTLGDAIRRKGEGKTDWEKLRREAAISLEPDRDPDEGEFDWSRARVDMPRPKQAISVRLDADILDFFRAGGRGYQTRINAVRRSYMEAHRTGPGTAGEPLRHSVNHESS